MHASDLSWISDRDLVQSLARTERRPSLLVRCPPDEREAVVAALVGWCAAPIHICRLPGALELPAIKRGTILLDGVSSLTLAQQIELQDWLAAAVGQIQVVSVTSDALWPLVDQGHFLEGLYYRLNVITLDAAPRR
jgi:transcriptional regulator of aromatic amino acid metabolism